MDVMGMHRLFTLAAFAGQGFPGGLEGDGGSMDRKRLESEALETLEALNRVWTVERAPERLARFFHPEMVAITPVDRERRDGAAACIQGWSGFAGAVSIKSWRTHGEKVQLWGGGSVAVITYYYDMSWETRDGRTVETAGRDMFVLAREDGCWLAVADQFSPYPGGK